jgi:large subunit ribosomal protein L7/L12
MIRRIFRAGVSGTRSGLGTVATRGLTAKIEREKVPFNYSELPLDVPAPDPVSAKVDEMVEEILSLNMIEYGMYLKRIQLRSGVTDETMISRMGNSMLAFDSSKEDGDEDGGEFEVEEAESKPAAAAVVEVKVKEFFDVKLGAVDPKSKIKIIKEIRTITSLGLKEAKELVEKAPVIVKTGLKKEEAEKIKKILVDNGAEVELL